MRLLRTAFLLLVVVAVFAVAASASAEDNSVSIIPASANVPQGGTVDVDVVIDPPSAGTSIWIIQVHYDPSVVQVVGCTAPFEQQQPNFSYAAACDTKDTNNDSIDDTAVAFGGYILNTSGTPRGFENTRSVATFTFKAVGPAGSQSPLHITVTVMLAPNGDTETPVTHDGLILIVAAPVGGAVEIVAAASGGSAVSTPIVAAALVSVGAAAYVAKRRTRRA